MSIRLSIIALLITSFLASCTIDVCSSKRMYVNAYDQFMRKVEKKNDQFTENQWKEMDEQFERFSGECFDQWEGDLTKEEKKQIIRHNLKYVVLRVKSELPFDLSKEDEAKVNEFLDEVDFEDFKDKGEELRKMWNDFDKTKFEEAAEEFGKGFEKLEKAFEELGEEIQELFDESQQKK